MSKSCEIDFLVKHYARRFSCVAFVELVADFLTVMTIIKNLSCIQGLAVNLNLVYNNFLI